MPTAINVIEENGLNLKISFSSPAKPIMDSVEREIEEQAKTFKMAGFRPGATPLPIVKKRIGPEILAKEIEKNVDSILKEYLKNEGKRPAVQPQVEVKKFDDKSDLIFEAKLELFPTIPIVEWEKIEIESLKIKVRDEDIKKGHNDIIQNFKNFNKASDDYDAKKGDAVMIDFVGKVDGEEFEANKGEGIRLELGSNKFIRGFEDQLVGCKNGQQKVVNVTYPKDYVNKNIANKEAIFDVHIHEVLIPESVEDIDDDFAKKLGLESLQKLNEMIEQKIESDFDGLTRLKTKKDLFDKIEKEYNFDIPDSMFKIDFDMMWNEVKKQYQKNPESFGHKPLEDLEKDYKKIAARRVRLGILLAEVARENNIEIQEQDLQQAVYAEAMQRPGQEKLVIDYYNNKDNLERLKGPLLEEKAVDYILTKIKNNVKTITSDEFFEVYSKDLTGSNNMNNKLEKTTPAA